MQIKSYTVLTCVEDANLESRVLAYLQHGWLPLGGVSVTYAKRPPRDWFWDTGEFGEPRLMYAQAMGHPDPQAFDPELDDPASAPVPAPAPSGADDATAKALEVQLATIRELVEDVRQANAAAQLADRIVLPTNHQNFAWHRLLIAVKHPAAGLAGDPVQHAARSVLGLTP
jgi:hypothetical protein